MYIAAGQIISAIQKMGFEVSAIQMFTLDRANVEEFYEIYKGVVNEYASMVDQLTTGACIALEIRAQNAAQTFREFVGPADPVSSLCPPTCTVHIFNLFL